MKKIDLVKLVEEVDKEEMIEGGVHKIFALTCLYKFIEMQEEAINYTHSCTELPNECGLLKNINGCDKGSGCRYPNCA